MIRYDKEGNVATEGVTEQWLTPGEAGYLALGWDDYVGKDVPIWSAKTTGLLAPLAAATAQWVHEAIEFEGKRTARIYYFTDDGRVDGCDLEIVLPTRSTEGS